MKLPLFVEAPQAEAGWTDPLAIDPGCTRCALSAGGVKHVCMKPEGTPGGLLLIAEMPGTTEDAVGRPFAGASGKYLRGLVAKHWTGPVAFDNAVRCAPGRTETTERHVEACRPYTSQVLEAVRPTRIVALGGWGALSILGRKPPVLSVRRGYGWWINDQLYPQPEAYVPVFFTVNPAAALRNRFVAADFEADLVWALTCPLPTPQGVAATVSLVRTTEDAAQAVLDLRAGAWVAFDTETSGVMFDRDFRIEMLTCYRDGTSHGWAWDREALEYPATREPLRALLADRHVKKAGHNLKYDALAVGCEPLLAVDLTDSMEIDTRLFRKLLEGEVSASLDVAAETVGMGGHKHEARAQIDGIKKDLARLAGEPHKPPTKTGKPRKPVVPEVLVRNAGGRPVLVPQPVLDKLWTERAEPIQYAYRYLDPAICARYNARDAYATALLAMATEPRIRAAPNLVNIWEGVVKPAMRALTKIERVGLPADRGAIDMFDTYLETKLQPVLGRLQVYGKEINFNSPVQLRALLFDRLGLPKVRTTDSGLDSTGEDVLVELKGKHPIIDDILEMRRLVTLQNRYAKGMRRFVRDDGRIHSSFLLDGAGTGRMSSMDPNLQNIPRPKDDKGNTEGKLARDIFVAPKGYMLLEADFSQLELRIAAMLSQDPRMIEFFNSGMDFHRATARMISKIAWGIPQEAWDKMSEKDQDPYRSKAKCFHPDTEVLTRSGWKKIPALTAGEEVLQAVPRRHGVDFEWAVPLEVFTTKHPSGQLVHLRNEGIDLRVTPDHRMLAFNTAGDHHVVMPEQLPDVRRWANAGVLPGGVQVDSALLRLAVAAQADGSVTPGRQLRFGFTKARKIERLARLLGEAGVSYTRTVQAHGATAFYLAKDAAAPVLALLDEKRLPWSWLGFSLEDREVVLDEARYWDAHTRPNWRMYRYASVDRQNVDVLQAVAASAGRKTRLVQHRAGVWSLTVRASSTTRGGTVACEKAPYTGEVACLSVPSTFVLVRDGGVPVVTGQTVNFGVHYGKTAEGLAYDLKCTVREADTVVQAILGEFKVLKRTMDRTLESARKHGGVFAYWDGKPANWRPLPNLAAQGRENDGRRKNAENAAWNTPVQGTAAHYATASLGPIQDGFDGEGLDAHVALTVHDSIMTVVRDDQYAEAAGIMGQVMTGHNSLGVPLLVDYKLGHQWGSLQKYVP